jgi:hypothetical protein
MRSLSLSDESIGVMPRLTLLDTLIGSALICATAIMFATPFVLAYLVRYPIPQ